MKDIFICSHSKKLKFGANLSKLTPWSKILNEYGCLSNSDIRLAFDKLKYDFTTDNLVNLLNLIDINFKDTSSAKIDTIYEVIGKTNYKCISIDFSDSNGGDRYVDYYLIDT